MVEKLSARIAIEGGDAAKKTFTDVGKAGESAFTSIDAAQKLAAKSTQDYAQALDGLDSRLSTIGSAASAAFSAVTASAQNIGLALFALGAAGAAAKASLSAVGAAAAEAAAEVGKSADKANLSIEAYQQFASAAKATGQNASIIEGGMSKLSSATSKTREELLRLTYSTGSTGKEIGKAADFASKAGAEIAGLGLSAQQSAALFRDFGVSVYEFDGSAERAQSAVKRITDAFDAMPEGLAKANRLRDLAKIVGPEFAAFLAQGTTAIKEQAAAIDGLVAPITSAERAIADEQQRSADVLDAVIKRARTRLGLLFAPLSTSSNNSTAALIGAISGTIEGFINNYVKPAIEVVQRFWAALKGEKYIPALAAAEKTAKNLSTSVGGITESVKGTPMERYWRSAAAGIDSASSSADKLYGKFVKVGGSMKDAFAAAGRPDLLRSVAQTTEDAADNSAKFAENIKKLADGNIESGWPKFWNDLRAESESTGALLRSNFIAIFGEDVWTQIKAAADAGWQSLRTGAAAAFSATRDFVSTEAPKIAEALRVSFNETWTAISDFARSNDLTTYEGLIRNATAAWAAIKATAREAVLWIGERVADVRENGWEGVQRTAELVWTQIKETVKRVWDSTIAALSNTDGAAIWDAFQKGAIRVWNAISEFVTKAYSEIKAAAEASFPTLSEPWEALETAVATVWARIRELFSGGVESVKNLITGLGFEGTWTGFETAAALVWARVKQLVADGYNWIKAQSIAAIPELNGFWTWLEGAATRVWAQVKAGATALWSQIGAIFKDQSISPWEKIQSLAQTAWGAVKTIVAGAAAEIIAAVGGIAAAIDEKFGAGATATLLAVAATVLGLGVVFSGVGSSLVKTGEEAGGTALKFGLLRGALGALSSVFGLLIASLEAVFPAFKKTSAAIAEGKSPTEALSAAFTGFAGIAQGVGLAIVLIGGAFEGLLIAIRPVTEIINKIFGSNISAEGVLIAAIILRMAGAFGVLSSAISVAWTAFTALRAATIFLAAGGLLPALQALATGAGAAFSALAAGATFLGGPLTVAIGLVAAALVALIAYWPELSAVADKTWQAVKDGANAAWEGVKSGWEGAKTALADGWEAIANASQGAWEKIKSGAASLWDEVGAILSNIKDGAVRAFNAVSQAVTPSANAAEAPAGASPVGGANINADAADTAQSIVEPFRTAKEEIAATLAELGPLVTQAFQSIGAQVATTAASITTPFEDAVRGLADIFGGIERYIQAAFDSLLSAISNAASAVNDAIASIISALEAAVARAQDLANAAQAAADAANSAGGGGSSGGTVSAAGGGYISGPGTSTSDSIPAWLSNGEFVVRAKAVRHWGVDFLRRLNGLSLRAPDLSFGRMGFADGGLVGAVRATGGAGGGASLHPLTLVMPGGQRIGGLAATPNAAAQLVKAAARRSVASTGRAPGWEAG